MFITKMSLPRRTFLRGMGVTAALPLLEAMIPALTATVKTAGNPVRRFGAVCLPQGKIMAHWTPTSEGTGFEFPPILKPLEPFRERMVVVSQMAGPPPVSEGFHAIAPASWLSGAIAKKTEGTDVLAGMTIDQVIAKAIGQDTPLPSLELATEDFTGSVGGCETGFSCSYMNTISWQSATSPLPMAINPRVVFERLFGGTGTTQQRLLRMQEDRSILDSVSEEAIRLQIGLGARDRVRLSEYLESVREIERRIQNAEKKGATNLTMPGAPVGVPDDFAEHVSLLFDLVAVAFQADITRVFTFMMARDASQRAYPEIGVPDGHHALSHHQNKPELMAKYGIINTYHVQQFARFLEKLRSTPDGDGTLLDHSMTLYGSSMSDGNVHSFYPLPLVVAGGGTGQVKSGRHLINPDKTPMGNLLLTLGQKAGVDTEAFGGSTGTIDL
jgi:hypothetical protein